MTYVESAIAAGLTPREMEHNIRNHVPLDEVGRAYGFDLLTFVCWRPGGDSTTCLGAASMGCTSSGSGGDEGDL